MKNAKRKVEVFGKEKLKMVKEIHTLILFAFHGTGNKDGSFQNPRPYSKDEFY